MAAVVLAAVVPALLLIPGGRHLAREIGLSDDPQFSVALSGGLFDARTLHDSDDGAADVAYLTGDASLTARVRARDAPGTQRVQLLVDGRPLATTRARCPGGDCPGVVVARFDPAVARRGPGSHRVELRAAPSAGAKAGRVAAFDVRVGAPPAAPAEIEPPSGAAAVAAQPDPAGARVARALGAAARTAPLQGLLGRSRLVAREHGRGAGVVTVLADVRPARRNVTEVLPQLGDDGPVLMRAAVLRDLLVDVDLRRGRAVAIEPGPGSAVTRWARVGAGGRRSAVSEDEAPSAAFTATQPPRLRRLSDAGFAFFAEDGDPSLRPDGRDWPVSVVFAGAASVAKVKAGLRKIGLTRRGHSRSLGYRLPGSSLLRFDGDRGLKGPCDADATDLHVRVYAPTATDRFSDPDFGDVVLATVHLDHVDGCGTGPSLFGFSERAERRLAALIAARLHWKVHVDGLAVGNAEPLRRDAADPGHIWLADGEATVVTVP